MSNDICLCGATGVCEVCRAVPRGELLDATYRPRPEPEQAGEGKRLGETVKQHLQRQLRESRAQVAAYRDELRDLVEAIKAQGYRVNDGFDWLHKADAALSMEGK